MHADILLQDQVDLGFNVITEPIWLRNQILRLANIDTPELGWRAKSQEEADRAEEARMFTVTWIAGHEDENGFILLETLKHQRHGKYGRFLAILWDSSQQINLADELKEAGLSK